MLFGNRICTQSCRVSARVFSVLSCVHCCVFNNHLRLCFVYLCFTSMIVEVVLDKAVIFVGVLLRPDVITERGLDPMDQLVRHGALLLPAILTAMDVADMLQLDRALRNGDAKPRATMLPPSTSRSASRLQNAGFAASMLCGFILAVFTIVAFLNQRGVCIAAVGSIAACARPHHYFKNGLFGTTTCAWGSVTEFDCGGEIIVPRALPENPDAFSMMENLRILNVSGSPNLVSLPQSLAEISSPQYRIDVRGSSKLLNVPFAVCRSDRRNLIQIDIADTTFATEIDWSGQLVEEDASFSDAGLSAACRAAFIRNKEHIHSVRLASNGLSCNDAMTCGFDFVSRLNRVSYLDLSNNRINEIDPEVSTLFIPVLLLNSTATGRDGGGVSLAGNQIVKIALALRRREEAVRILKTFYGADVSTTTEIAVESTNMTQDDLEELRPHLARMPDLETIKLKNQAIRSVTGLFYNCCSKLSSVDLTGNSRVGQSGLAKAFAGLERLREVRIYEMGLSGDLGQVFDYDLPALTALLAFDNEFSELGEALSHMPNLDWLEMGNNRLHDAALDGKLTGLNHLESLFLHNNMLVHIPDHFFAGLPSLRRLDVSQNQELTAGEHAFTGMPSLAELSIFKTKIDPGKGLVFGPSLRVLFFFPAAFLPGYNGVLESRNTSVLATWDASITLICDAQNLRNWQDEPAGCLRRRYL